MSELGALPIKKQYCYLLFILSNKIHNSPLKKTAAFLIIILILFGCFPIDPDYKFEYETIITDTPTNLEKLNTTNDDYNSDLPYPATRSEIYFSSNRNSGGDN